MKPRLLLVTHVHPFPSMAGQQQRVRYTLRALGDSFQITVLTVAPPASRNDIERKWLQFVEDVVVLPSVSQRHLIARSYHKLRARMFQSMTGLKESNYILGSVEFTPGRIESAVDVSTFDIVLFEYWHTHQCAALFRERGIPAVLDMHDVLWQSLKRQLASAGKRRGARRVEHYRRREEAAWKEYSGLIAINEGEAEYVRSLLPHSPLFLAQMGTDLTQWPYLFEPSRPQRIGFWGSLSSEVNRASAARAAKEIMPRIWEQHPDVEFWIIGANPPAELLELQRDPRIRVTGYVETAAPLLGSMTAVLCPWEGTYGFRSRLIEVMACGVPVIASPDAVYGMGMVQGDGLFLEATNDGFAASSLALIEDGAYAKQQSERARRQVENKFSYEATYGQLAAQLLTLVKAR